MTLTSWPGSLDQRLAHLDRVANDRHQIDALAAQLQPIVGDAADVEQVVHEPGHQPDLPLDHLRDTIDERIRAACGFSAAPPRCGPAPADCAVRARASPGTCSCAGRRRAATRRVDLRRADARAPAGRWCRPPTRAGADISTISVSVRIAVPNGEIVVAGLLTPQSKHAPATIGTTITAGRTRRISSPAAVWSSSSRTGACSGMLSTTPMETASTNVDVCSAMTVIVGTRVERAGAVEIPDEREAGDGRGDQRERSARPLAATDATGSTPARSPARASSTTVAPGGPMRPGTMHAACVPRCGRRGRARRCRDRCRWRTGRAPCRRSPRRARRGRLAGAAIAARQQQHREAPPPSRRSRRSVESRCPSSTSPPDAARRRRRR